MALPFHTQQMQVAISNDHSHARQYKLQSSVLQLWSAGLTGAESAVSRRMENYILFMVYNSELVMHHLMLILFMAFSDSGTMDNIYP